MTIRIIDADTLIHSFDDNYMHMDFLPNGKQTYIINLLTELNTADFTRTQKARKAQEAWEFFLLKALNSITDNHRGFAELCKYYDEFVKYENYLFAIDKNHRDHTIHSIWVMLLGYYFIFNEPTFNSLEHLFKYANNTANDRERFIQKIRENEKELWCITSLIHDLGYPIEKTKKANDIMSKMINNYGLLSTQVFDYGFSAVHQTAIEELLNSLSATIYLNGNDSFSVHFGPGNKIDYAKSMERLDHGIMSAYLVQLYLDFICEGINITRGGTGLYKDIDIGSRHTMTVTMLEAIASHTNRNSYTPMFNDIRTLLFLCDELEEFSRYYLSEERGEWIDSNCITSYEVDNHNLQMYYLFNDDNIEDDAIEFFWKKVRKLNSRFRMKSGEIEKVFMACVDLRNEKYKAYAYESTPTECKVYLDGENIENVPKKILEVTQGQVI